LQDHLEWVVVFDCFRVVVKKEKAMRFLSCMVLVLALTGPAFGDPVVTEVKDPRYLQNIRDIINNVEPRGEAFWNLESNDWNAAVAGSVLPLYGYADVKLGMAIDKIPYVGVDTDLFTLGEVLLPAKIKEVLEGVPQFIQDMARDYARVGFVGGYSWDTNDPVYGPTFGASVDF